jgi:ribonuclease HI
MSKYYAVHIGKVPGVYKTWDETKEQVDSIKGAIYKRFSSLDSAIYYAKNGTIKEEKPILRSKTKTKKNHWSKSKKSVLVSVPDSFESKNKDVDVDGNEEEDTDEKSRKDTNQCKIYLKRFRESVTVEDDIIVIYTDGSAINNGQKNARGGYGVFFDDPSISPISEPLTGDKITNNVAELMAIITGLTKVKNDTRKKIVLSDSQYAVLAINERYKKYIKNNWITTYGGTTKSVSNANLIKQAVSLVVGKNVILKHIYACHSNPILPNELGNYLADRLANQVVSLDIFN